MDLSCIPSMHIYLYHIHSLVVVLVVFSLSLLTAARFEAYCRGAGEGEGLLLYKAERHRAHLPGK